MTDRNLRRLTQATLILTSNVFGALLIPDAVAIMMSAMAFDSGVSTFALLFVGCILSFPLVVLIAIAGSLLSYRKGAYRRAILVSLLPSINVLVLATMFLFEGQ